MINLKNMKFFYYFYCAKLTNITMKKLLTYTILILLYLPTFSQIDLLENSEIEHVFYSEQVIKIDREEEKNLKLKIDTETPSPENYLGQKLLKDVLKEELIAYKVIETSPAKEINSKARSKKKTVSISLPTYYKESPVSREDLKDYIKSVNAYLVENKKEALTGESITDAELVLYLGQYSKVIKHSYYYYHPKLKKIVSYVVGIELVPERYSLDTEAEQSNYNGEKLFIPLNPPSLNDYKEVSVNRAEICWAARTFENVAFQSKTRSSVYRVNQPNAIFIKDNGADFLQSYLRAPIQNNQKKIYATTKDALANVNRKDITLVDSIFNRTTIDTVEIYDYKKDKYVSQLVVNEGPTFEDISVFGFIEENYFFDTHKSLISIVEFVVPREVVNDDMGNLRGYQRLFTVKY